MFNDVFHMLPKVEILTEKRKALIENFMNNRKREKADYSIDELSGIF